MAGSVSGKRVLVVGATGYLGRRLVRALAGRGAYVRALVRPGTRLEEAHECFEARATEAATLRGVCDGMDWVFSSLGITRQRDRGVTYEDVDYGANVALLEEAERAKVERYGVIAVVDPERFRGNPMVDAKVRFVRKLRDSRVSGRVVAATGFFNDMKELFEMARKGTVFLFGNGRTRINPIDGVDVAEAAVDALRGETDEVSVGGPDVFTWDEIAALACQSLSKAIRRRHVPIGLVRPVLPAARLFSNKAATTLDFVLRVSERDLVAPKVGRRHLADYFHELARGGSQ